MTPMWTMQCGAFFLSAINVDFRRRSRFNTSISGGFLGKLLLSTPMTSKEPARRWAINCPSEPLIPVKRTRSGLVFDIFFSPARDQIRLHTKADNAIGALESKNKREQISVSRRQFWHILSSWDRIGNGALAMGSRS